MKLLLITGWGFTGEVWRPVEKVSNEKWKIKKLDFLGPNILAVDSSKFPELLKNKITDFRPDAAVGWSMGAIALLEVLIKFELPDFVTVLLSGTSRFVQPDETDPPGVSSVRLRAMRRGIKREPKKSILDFYELAAQPENMGPDYGKPEKITDNKSQLLEGLKYLGEVDLTGGLDKLDRPVKLIHGKQDAVVPVSAGRYLAENLKRVELVELDGGHLAPVQKNEILEEVIYSNLE